MKWIHRSLLTSCLLHLFITMQAQFVQPANDTLGRKFLVRNNLEEQKILGINELGTLYVLTQDGMICLAPEMAENAIMPNAFPGTGNIDPQPFPFYFNRPPMPVAPLRPIRKPAIKPAPGSKLSGKPLTEAELAEMIQQNREKKAPAFSHPKAVKPAQ